MLEDVIWASCVVPCLKFQVSNMVAVPRAVRESIFVNVKCANLGRRTAIDGSDPAVVGSKNTSKHATAPICDRQAEIIMGLAHAAL